MTNYDQKSHFLLKEEQPTLERTSMEVFTYLKSNGQHEKKFKNVWKNLSEVYQHSRKWNDLKIAEKIKKIRREVKDQNPGTEKISHFNRRSTRLQVLIGIDYSNGYWKFSGTSHGKPHIKLES
ncbi:hypothetical protein RUM44_005011 [Polyplax serrata]|uniref:Uncharacterized protein n=1 Tax=Polyplax serrata TaxID=468196 RepID=A0ABR1AWP4_POLSC